MFSGCYTSSALTHCIDNENPQLELTGISNAEPHLPARTGCDVHFLSERHGTDHLLSLRIAFPPLFTSATAGCRVPGVRLLCILETADVGDIKGNLEEGATYRFTLDRFGRRPR
jgi:hypothetical protein